MGKIFLGWKFTIQEQEFHQVESEWSNVLQVKRDKNGDELFAKVLMWTLERTEISCNAIINRFNVGWKRASNFTDRLCDLGIVEGLDAKLPRKVCPQSIEDIPEDVMDVLLNNGVSAEKIEEAINRKEK